MDIRLIALDLDGTLLNSEKQLTARNYRALERAHAAGVHIVPTTGRFYNLLPEVIRTLPFMRYAITINGAAVFDLQEKKTLAAAEIPPEEAVEIMAYLDGFDVIYDCYTGNAGYMTERLQNMARLYAGNPHCYAMLRDFRKPVPELKDFVWTGGQGIQKIQMYVKPENLALRSFLMEELGRRFPDLAVSSAFFNNIELNQSHANKGEALLALAAALGLKREQTMSFGDGLNDLSMIRAAGFGVAMANGEQATLDVADYICESCDEDGVARTIEKFILGEEGN